MSSNMNPDWARLLGLSPLAVAAFAIGACAGSPNNDGNSGGTPPGAGGTKITSAGGTESVGGSKTENGTTGGVLSGGGASGGTAPGNSGGTSSGGLHGTGASAGSGAASGTGGAPPLECRTDAGAKCALTECDPPKHYGWHAEPCTPLTFYSNPPTSGTHYDIWAAYQIYTQPVPVGFWLHSIEHSGAALLYNCAEAQKVGLDCKALVAELTTFFDNWPQDPLCTATRHRLLITPYPDLDAPFAVAMWGHYLKGNCFDANVVTTFINQYYGKNYENECDPGVNPFNGQYPSTCGQLD
jgi:hypothetical protein